MDLDRQLADAKETILNTLVRVSNGEALLGKAYSDLDELNRSWDAVTSALMRQRDERDRVIRRLIDELAELRGGKK